MLGQDLDDFVMRVAGPRLLDHLVDAEELTCTHTLRDAEERIAARVRLVKTLVDEGWTPPRAVADQLQRDEALLGLPGREKQS